MYKVLIVDDEVLVRVGLKTMIDWEAIGFVIVGEAANGEAGFEQYLKHKPEVIITDIKMPKQDGLWLVEKVRKDNPHVKILVLTCYDEFSFARKALKVGADDYILKSEVEDEELIKIMHTIKGKIDSQNKNKVSQDNPLNSIEDHKKSIVSELIKKEFHWDDPLMERLKGIDFLVKDTSFAYASISIINHEEVQTDQTQVNNAVLNILFEQFNQKAIGYLDMHQGNKYVFFMSSPTMTTAELKRILMVVSNGAKQYFNVSLNSVISTVFNELDDAGMLYKEFSEKAQILFYRNNRTSSILQTDAVNFQEPNVFDLKKMYNKNFIEAIGQENLEKSNELIKEVGDYFEQNKVNPMIVKIFYSNLMGDIFGSYGLFIDNLEVFKTHKHYHYQIEHSERIENIIQLLTGFTAKVINEIQNMRYNNSKLMINRALNFIENHFQENISLDDVAKELNLSKQYLCGTFKKETGQNMSLYINKLRIEKAKQMLLGSDVKIKEIFETIGYSNQQYFSKVFKKITGMTVVAYKESMQKK